MNQYAVWRLCAVPGNVDYLGTIAAESLDAAEMTARLMWPCDEGEELEVELDEESEVRP